MNLKNRLDLQLGKYQKQVDICLRELGEQNFVGRLWAKDGTLWNREAEKHPSTQLSMGWLGAVDKMIASLPILEEFVSDCDKAEYTHIVLLGNGGSIQGASVFLNAFPDALNAGKFRIIDHAYPETIRKVAAEISIDTTLFIICGKSAHTLEGSALFEYFFGLVSARKKEKAGENFIAITDENSDLARLARKKGFRKTFIDFPGIDERFSVLSYFGIVPAVLMGINVKEILGRTQSMINSCTSSVNLHLNPGVGLGASLAVLVSHGCNKLTGFLPPSLKAFSLWLEQLLLEHSVKNRKGIVPVNGINFSKIHSYGCDRMFLQVSWPGEPDTVQSQILRQYVSMKYPVIQIEISDRYNIGQEFFRWEIACATMAYLLGVNVFGVEKPSESRKHASTFLADFQDGRSLEVPSNLIHYNTLREIKTDKTILADLFGGGENFQFVVINAFLPESDSVCRRLKEIQMLIQDSWNLPASVQFGPRYLHGEGSFCKDGPANGVIIQFIYSPEEDFIIPRKGYTFGTLTKALAVGDAETLLENNLKILLVDLGGNCSEGLDLFWHCIRETSLMMGGKQSSGFMDAPEDMATMALSPGMEML